MSAEVVYETMATSRVVPVLVVDDPADAPALADALIAGGLRLAEVTLRTPAGVEALRALADRDELVVGAGTVRTVEQADLVIAAGARFVISPGFDARVVGRCQDRGVPVFPGVATASEIQAAATCGLRLV